MLDQGPGSGAPLSFTPKNHGGFEALEFRAARPWLAVFIRAFFLVLALALYL